MMKKQIFGLLAAMLALPVFGAYQYSTPDVTLGKGNSLHFNTAGNMVFEMVQAAGGDRASVIFGMNGGGATYSEAALPGGQFLFRNEGGTEAEIAAGSVIEFWASVDGSQGTFAGMVYGEDGSLYVGFNTTGAGTAAGGDADYIFKIPVTNTPSGQPLPGVLAALAVGGAVVLYRRRRRRA